MSAAPTSESFDVIVIGGGPGGYVAAALFLVDIKNQLESPQQMLLGL